MHSSSGTASVTAIDEEFDESFARLIERFQDKLSDETVMNVLLECNGQEHEASQRLLKIQSDCLPLQQSRLRSPRNTPLKHRQLLRMTNYFESRSKQSSPSDIPPPMPELTQFNHTSSNHSCKNAMQVLIQNSIKLESEDSDKINSQPPILLTPETLAVHTPCEMFMDILPLSDADALLQQMVVESKTWNPLSVVVVGKLLQSSHNTCLYTDHEILGDMPLYYSGVKSEPRDWLPSMRLAAKIIEEKVNCAYEKRERAALELQGRWVPGIAIANSYHTRHESTGMHTDRLTYIGPRPVIASLTLGAARVFRVRRLRNTGMPSQTYDILLPHNSLLIMWPPMQECFKHELPPVSESLVRRTGTLISHPLSGDTRINLTFRMVRRDVVEQIPICKCGSPAEMRCVIKKMDARGQYFWICSGGLGPNVIDGTIRQCGFFKWF
ncbi:hypothetical protein QVD99_002067 [Batrachochytrium dendrobatidis]|nr:hypothetical protein QVD99_002067 [Batrachochytrium dendrobatidis]